MLELYVAAFATLFVLIDPIGVTPMFAALTAGASPKERVMIAIRGVGVAGALLVIFGLFGTNLLEALGISLPAFRVAGGLMLFLVAVEMLFQKRTERRENEADKAAAIDDPSVFPLAMPLLAGPGALAAMMLLTSRAEGSEVAAVYLAAGTVLAISMAAFSMTAFIERVLGDAGIRVLTRVFGMLLGALAVQFVFDGLIALWGQVG
ncbi:MAG: MarC family protein [Pseudomonadota bacterium]